MGSLVPDSSPFCPTWVDSWCRRVGSLVADGQFCRTWMDLWCSRQEGYIKLRVCIDYCIMNFPPKWEILSYAVSKAMGVCDDTSKSNDEALDALRYADDTFDAVMLWGPAVNFGSGTLKERLYFINQRHEIHLMMIDRGVTCFHSH